MAESNLVLADEGIVDVDGNFTESEIFAYFGTKMGLSGSSSPKRFLVFRSEDDEELDPSLYRSLSPLSIINNLTIKDKIRIALEHVDLAYSYSILAQFWASLTIDGRCFLQTLNQPFGMTYLGKGLASFRKLSSSFQYSFPSSAGGSTVNLDDEKKSNVLTAGPPLRAFVNGFPEYSPDVEFYSEKEYPLRQYTVHCKIKNHMVVPVFESDSQRCVGVVELVSTSGPKGATARFQPEIEMDKPVYIFGLISTAFQGVGLRTSTFTPHFELENRLAPSSMGRSSALRDIWAAMHDACISHGLLFAQTWTRMEFNGNAPYALSTTSYEYYQSHRGFSIFRDICESFHLTSGGGVVSKAFTSGGSCFCRDIGQLSTTDYSFSHVARKVMLTASFAICLKSHQYDHTGNLHPDVYVLEFFLPSTASENPQEILEPVLLTMNKYLTGFVTGCGQNLESGINVQVLSVSKDDDTRQEYFRLFPDNSSGDSVLDDQSSSMRPEPTMIAVGQSGLEDSAGGKAESNNAFNYSEIQAIDNLRELEWLSHLRELEWPSHLYGFDSTGEESYDTRSKKGGDALTSTFVPFGCREEQSSDSRSVKGTGSSYNNSSVSTSRFPEKDSWVADQGNFFGIPLVVRNVVSAYTSTLEETTDKLKEKIEQHYGKTLEEAASSMKVSTSTLKRKCRSVGIKRWPRRKPNGGASSAATVEETKQNQERKCEDDIRLKCSAEAGGKEPSTTTLSTDNCSSKTVAILRPGSFMTVKARYQKHVMIKFQLPFSSPLMQMESEVASRLKLEIGSFKLWYMDEENEFILLTCDADLRTMESMEKSTIKACVTHGDSAPEWIH